MSLWKIAWRSIQQRGLASSLTGMSMALGVMLVVAVLVIHGAINNSFLNNSSLGYNVLVGAKGGRMELVLNSVYYLARPVENIPYSYYQEFVDGQYAGYVDKAVPLCLGDMFQEYRVVGTTPDFFNQLDHGGEPYRFAEGANFEQDDFFGAVVGATVARATGLKVGDEFNPTHGVGPDAHVHDPFIIRGVLEPTGTPNDRALFINMEGFFLIPEHAKPVDAATASAQASPDAHQHGDAEAGPHTDDGDHGHEPHEHGDHAHEDHSHEDHSHKDHADDAEHEHPGEGHGRDGEPGHDADAGDDADHDATHAHDDDAEHAADAPDEHDGHDHKHDEAAAEHDHQAGEHSHEDPADEGKHDHDHQHGQGARSATHAADSHDHEGHEHEGDPHDHEAHDHGAHGHAHQHAHAPLPVEQREVTSILVLTASIGGAPPELMAMPLMNGINEGNVAQAVQPIREMTNLFDLFVNPLRTVLLGLTVMIVVVSGIGILVSIYNSMAERQHEIAVMRALGAGRQTVMLLVLLESILLSLAGGLAGWLVGHGLIALLGPWIELRTGVSLGFFQFVGYELVIIPGLIVLAAVVGYLPALAAYRTDVAKALSATP